MKEINNSIYHDPEEGLLAHVEVDGVRRFCTLQGLESRIEAERRHLRDVSHLVEAHDQLALADRDYQNALWIHGYVHPWPSGEDAPVNHK